MVSEAKFKQRENQDSQKVSGCDSDPRVARGEVPSQALRGNHESDHQHETGQAGRSLTEPAMPIHPVSGDKRGLHDQHGPGGEKHAVNVHDQGMWRKHIGLPGRHSEPARKRICLHEAQKHSHFREHSESLKENEVVAGSEPRLRSFNPHCSLLDSTKVPLVPIAEEDGERIDLKPGGAELSAPARTVDSWIENRKQEYFNKRGSNIRQLLTG
jgi:hypothetical protein